MHSVESALPLVFSSLRKCREVKGSELGVCPRQEREERDVRMVYVRGVKKYAFAKRKGTVDGYEWCYRNQSKDNRHDVVRSVRKGTLV
ncbi:hypothetical protein TNCV_3702381 [Trichonephila clavipes]|nr:hypothetical protein TNCV_3702381 [Trichonephila clavipes]